MDAKEKIKERLPNVNHEDINKLSNEQADFIVHPLNISCFLSACPGSGKTQVVGIKTAYEIADWQDKFSGMAVLSFTKRAAKEIADRVAKYDGINATKHPHFIGTIDSWLHSFILHPFGHIIGNFKGREADKSYNLVDNTERGEKYPFLSSFETEYYSDDGKPNPIQVNNFYFTFEGKPECLKIDFTKFDDQKINKLITNKSNFLKAGLCTYQDAEYLCYKVLERNKNLLSTLSRRFTAIMIDECQDLSQSQIRLFDLLKSEGVYFHFIGDLNQAIYDFRKVYVDNFKNFIEYRKIQEKKLTDNYRSNQQIVDVCGRIVKGITSDNLSVKGIEEVLHTESVLLWVYDNDIQDLPNKFISLLNQRGLDVSKSSILGRSHSLLSKIRPDTSSEYNKIQLFANALNCWNIPNRTGKDMQNALQQIGKSISYLAYNGQGNSQQQYCRENLSQVEWRKFLYELLSAASEVRLHNFEEKTWSEWTGLLKSFLENYWQKLPNGNKNWDDVKRAVQAPKGDSKKIVSTIIKTKYGIGSEQIRITTIHDVKGETFDAVLLVSAQDKKSKGGHVEQWIGLDNEAKEEHIRFAYVASSRPKHLLVWAIPSKVQGNQDIQSLLGCN